MLVMAATRTTRSLSAAEQLEASKKLYVKTEALRETKQPPPGSPTSPSFPLRDVKQFPSSGCAEGSAPQPPPVPPRPPRRNRIDRATSLKQLVGFPPSDPPPPLPPRRKSTSKDERGDDSPSMSSINDWKEHQDLGTPPVPPPRPSKGIHASAARKASTPVPATAYESRLSSTPQWARQSTPNLLKLGGTDVPFSTVKDSPRDFLVTPSWAKKSLPSLMAGDAAIAADLCDSSTVHARSAKSLYSQPSFDDDAFEAGCSHNRLAGGDGGSTAVSEGGDLVVTNVADSFFDSMGVAPAILRSFDQQLLFNATGSRTGSFSSVLTSITNNNCCAWSKGDSDSIASDLPTSKMTGAARRPVSIIEKNARVIKWIHGCRVAPTPGGEVRAKVIGFEFGASPADV
uniref:Centrosome-associated FAM110 C-terminal domain-containing protein n=1 Tax=Plectus sambesii TaxID=2011161 RepID=A0A914WUK2_9BILA